MEPKCDVDDLVLAPLDDAEWFDFESGMLTDGPYCAVAMKSPVLGLVYCLARRDKVIEYFGISDDEMDVDEPGIKR